MDLFKENKTLSTAKKGATKHCAYGTCNSDSRYPDRPSMKGVSFIRFPQVKKEPEKCKKWALACRRQGFDENSVTKDTYICSLHFVDANGPTDDHPNPVPATATKYDVERLTRKPRRKVQRRLALTPKKTFENLENLDVLTTFESRDETEIAEESELANILLSLQDPVISENVDEEENSIEVQEKKRQRSETDIPKNIEHNSVECQTDTTSLEMSLRIGIKILENENKLLKSKLEMLMEDHSGDKTKQNNKNSSDSSENKSVDSENNRESRSVHFDIEDIKGDNKKSKFYTGLTWIQFMQLWRFIYPAVDKLRYWNRSQRDKVDTSKYKISPQNALLMTLMRLRRGYSIQDLSYRFGVSTATVSNTVLTWIQFLYKQFLPLKNEMFATRHHIRGKLPKAFKKYKNIRCIIDCTEFYVQRPSNFHRQGNLYSSYKGNPTYKVLIAVAPNGAIMYVSDVFEGSISDRDIIIRSGFLDHLEPGDSVMADRGFNCKDLFNERKVHLIIPPFLAGRNRLTPQEEAETKDVAKHRIHVERAIERVKKFKLVSNRIPLCLEPIITQVIFVVCCLVNFQEPLVK